MGRTKDASGRSFYHFSSENERFCPFVRFSNDGEFLCAAGKVRRCWNDLMRPGFVLLLLFSSVNEVELVKIPAELSSCGRSLGFTCTRRLRPSETHLCDTLLSEKRVCHTNTRLLNTLYFIFDICCISEVISMVECVLDQYRLY